MAVGGDADRTVLVDEPRHRHVRDHPGEHHEHTRPRSHCRVHRLRAARRVPGGDTLIAHVRQRTGGHRGSNRRRAPAEVHAAARVGCRVPAADHHGDHDHLSQHQSRHGFWLHHGEWRERFGQIPDRGRGRHTGHCRQRQVEPVLRHRHHAGLAVLHARGVPRRCRAGRGQRADV